MPASGCGPPQPTQRPRNLIRSGVFACPRCSRRPWTPRTGEHILGGILALDSEWKPALGDPLITALGKNPDGRLDFSCAALHGTFACAADGAITITNNAKAATAFLLELIARLQEVGTVSMMDTQAYARWLPP